MRITANQVTFVRLVLLPLPVAMVYQSRSPADGPTTPVETAWLLGALGVFILLGLTDALDGMLARRYGGTRLGALLDPIVDKIFLVAGFIPLADFRAISIGLVSVMFVRELAVTVLRSIAAQEKVTFRTSRIAKLKTTVQMAGAGFLLLVFMFPRDRVILPILGVAALLSLIPAGAALARGRLPDWRAAWGAGLIASIAPFRWALGRDHMMTFIVLVIVGFTLVSGTEYMWGMRGVLAARFARSPVEAVRLAVLSLAIPALLLPAVDLPEAVLGVKILIMGVLAAELAVGGLDNSLAQRGLDRGPWPDLLRAGLQGLAGGMLLAFPAGARGWIPVTGGVWAALALTLTLVDLTLRLARNRSVFRADLP